MEQWKNIEWYEGLYKVSSYGRVKSLSDRWGKERILKPKKDKNGYLVVGFHKDGACKTYKIHRLVAQTFIENPNNLPQVNHKDENKENNCVENLEWCNVKYNTNYGTRTERVANKNTNHPSTSKQVYQYSLKGELIKIWQSISECGRNGFCETSVSDCCKGKNKTHKGYIWKYEQ